MNLDNLLGDLTGPSKRKQTKKDTPDSLLNDLIQQGQQPQRPHTQQVQTRHRPAVNMANMNNMFADEPANKRPATVASAPKLEADCDVEPVVEQRRPQTQQSGAVDNIWSAPSGKRRPQQLAGSMPLLKDAIESDSSLGDFFQLLFADKRVKAISDNWYQGLRCLEMDKEIDINNPRTWAIKQVSGGPCGFIAAVQARAIKFLFMKQKPEIVIPSKPFRSAILSSLFEIFAKLGSQFKVVLPLRFEEENIPVDRIVQEMDRFGAKSLRSQEELKQLFASAAFQNYCFQETSSFIPAIVFSVVLSKGALKIRNEDFDKDSQIATGSLFANFNNCSQELVNLLITGKATPNIHDGALDVGGLVLNGIEERQDIGLLTIYEHHEYLNVGACLKAPTNNIWVVFNEAHFTTLFTLDRDFKAKNQVDFVFMDQLDDQKKLCRITVQVNQEKFKKVKEPESYVEAIIQTLVPSVGFSWNGFDKYLS